MLINDIFAKLMTSDTVFFFTDFTGTVSKHEYSRTLVSAITRLAATHYERVGCLTWFDEDAWALRAWEFVKRLPPAKKKAYARNKGYVFTSRLHGPGVAKYMVYIIGNEDSVSLRGNDIIRFALTDNLFDIKEHFSDQTYEHIQLVTEDQIVMFMTLKNNVKMPSYDELNESSNPKQKT
jgi:hypothetical protein